MAIRFTDAVIAQRYALFRPHYPDSLREGLLGYIRQRSAVPIEKQLVVDVGCGAGQSTIFLAKAGFGKVLGVDTSQAQIDEASAILQKEDQHAAGHGQVEFRIADADRDLSTAERSVDVVTLGQALHWFNFPEFYRQVDRSLKPGGLFLAFGYGNCRVQDVGVQSLVSNFYHQKMGTYWSKERRYIDNHYATIPMPYEPVDRLTTELQYSLTLASLIGYIGSWSAYATYCAEHPGTTIMEELKEKLTDAVRSSPALMERFHERKDGDATEIREQDRDIGEAELEIKFPIFALMCQKPA